MLSTPPRVITSKDLSYLKDQMSWELIAMKKCNHYAQEATMPEVKNMVNRIGQMHQQHYQKLLKHLQINNTIAMSQIAGQMAQQQQQQMQGINNHS